MRISQSVRNAKIRLAITHGDAAGIGPEVLVKALAAWPNRHSAQILVLSRAFLLNALSRKYKLDLQFEDIPSPDCSTGVLSNIPCYFKDPMPSEFTRGVSQKDLTVAAVKSIELAADLAIKKQVDGMITAPINKAGLKKAGFNIPGHTEFLAELAGVDRYEMMLIGGPLRVVLVTRHEPIQKVSFMLTKKKIEQAILTADKELRMSFGIKRPRIVVCGLNPHAGEEGHIGKEEVRVIGPAVKSAQLKTNAEITGPLAPDALFCDAFQGRYDAEICMYHDQGLIPLKMISRGHGVNVTLGLPFVRTSPDHGTAYDIAGKGVADPGSMIQAFECAFQMVKSRRR